MASSYSISVAPLPSTTSGESDSAPNSEMTCGLFARCSTDPAPALREADSRARDEVVEYSSDSRPLTRQPSEGLLQAVLGLPDDSASTRWTNEIAIDPSPTADAARWMFPHRSSPASEKSHEPRGAADPFRLHKACTERTRDNIPFAPSAMIEVFYNQRRRHSRLGQVSPAAYERRTHAA